MIKKEYIQEKIVFLSKSYQLVKVETLELFKQFNETYKPTDFANTHKKQIFIACLILVFVFFYPLFSIWLLASAVPLYQGNKIIKSLMLDYKIKKNGILKQKYMNDFLKEAIRDGRIIILHVKQINRYVERKCIVASSNDEGITVKDFDTKMIITYPFYKIDYDALYDREVAPNIGNIEGNQDRNILSKIFNL